jgi:signal transduction histidine kinase
MHPDRSQAVVRLLRELSGHLGNVRDDDRVLRFAIRSLREFFEATHACVAVRTAGGDLDIPYEIPYGAVWDAGLLSAFLRGEHPRIPFDVLIVPLARRGRRWGALCLRRADRNFERGDGRLLGFIAGHIEQRLERIDHDRVREARSRIDQKVSEALRPRDLFYQVLHTLRALTRYDHSSTLLMAMDGGRGLTVAAEQIAWTKARSRRIGLKVDLSSRASMLLKESGAMGFRRDGAEWRAWRGPAEAVTLAGVLEYSTRSETSEAPPESAMLCAPIVTRDGVIGAIRVASIDPSILDEYELELVGRFTPHASMAIQYLQRTEHLKRRMLEAERRNALANLARGVSHDVNNALGSILPLVQQLRHELQSGQIVVETWAADLEQIESGVQVGRRIFGNLLGFARDSSGKVGHANLRRAVDAAMSILGGAMSRSGIQIDVDIAGDLPLLRGKQGDLEQLLLNFSTNARDAMPNGGVLRIAARPLESGVEVEVRDNGCGIPREDLDKLYEPFFTTKANGNGLGLSICRSIVWSLRGRLDVESDGPGKGTVIRFWLPSVVSRDATEVS